MNNDAIMDRIAKLLAKAKGTTNEHEASIFMAKAAEMLAEHNLTEAMIAARESGKDDPIGRHPYTNKLYSWHDPLIRALGLLYFCTVINERTGYVFFRREANAKLASSIAEYLISTIRRMSREYSPTKAIQEDFKRGAAARMFERLIALYHEQNVPKATPMGSNLPALYKTELAETRDFALACRHLWQAGKGPGNSHQREG